jgi:capsular polysaccharide transport system permease protein
MTDSTAPRLRPIHRQLRFATLRVVAALMLREMTTTYGRKPGGYIWMIVEPVAGIALLSWIFISVGFKQPALGTNFPIFYATGLLPYFTAMTVSSKLSGALRSSRALLAYPRVTLVDVLVARYVITLLTQLVVAYILLAGMVVLLDTGTDIRLNRIVLGFAMAAALGAGLGILNCYLASQFELWSSIWSVATRPLVLISGVIIMIDRLPLQWQSYIAWNPLVHVVAQVRSGFYHGYDPHYLSPAWVFGLAMAFGAVGLLFLWRTYRYLLEI